MLIGRLMWVYFQQISNCCRLVWLTDWQTDTISYWPTADHVRHFAATAFLCCGSCVQWVIGFLYGRCKQLFDSVLNNAYFSRHLFENSVWVAKSCITVCFTYCLRIATFNTDISQGSVATCLECGGYLNTTLLEISYWV